jgi:hypothetical protein
VLRGTPEADMKLLAVNGVEAALPVTVIYQGNILRNS